MELHDEDGGSPDQRIIYCKYGDGDVVFDNGATVSAGEFLPISEDERSLFNEKYADNVRKVDLLSRIGEIPDVGDFVLFSDEEMLSVARFPNRYDDGSDGFIKGAVTYNDDPDLSTLLITNVLLARRLASYPEDRIPEMLLYGYIVRGFRKDTFTVESYDADSRLLRVGYGSSEEFGHKLRYEWDDGGDGARMAVLNVPYELDAAGEYWVDRSTGTLYVFDPRGEYHIPMPQGEKRVRGVDYETIEGNHVMAEQYCAICAEETGYVTLRGLDFKNAMDGFVLGYRTSGFEIDRCSFECCTGRDMVLFEKSLPNEPLGLRVTDCEFDLCVGRHVFVFDEASGPNRFTDRSDVLIDNCLFSHANLAYDVEGAVTLHCCSGGVVSHNRFESCHRYAVSFFGSCDVVVEYNDFDSAMTNSDDGGVTYGFSDMIGNNVIRYNFYNTVTGGSVGRLSHYCDNADCGTLMYSNLIYEGGVVCYHGAGRDNVLSDNVMIGLNAGSSCGSLTGTVVEDGVEKTVVTGDWMYGYVMREWEKIRGYAETVPGYAEALEARRPGALSLSLDPDEAGNLNHVMAPTNTFTGNLFVNENASIKLEFVGNAADYCTIEGNTAYTYGENPVFVNPTLGDYRIRAGVDFPDYHFEKIGRY